MENLRKTEEKVFSYIVENHMLSPGHRVVAGVSGGADSVCLLFVLLEYARRMPLKLAVVHVNHGLREDAGEDAAFVEELCRQENIPFFLKEVNVYALAVEKRCSQEEAGRLLRYEAFREAAEAFGADRIAVAHSGNDRAETMLFHLFRGSGLKGLCGIPPRREKIIRPLLCLERREIEEYLAGRGLKYRTDSTNLSDDYTRNRIRHHILSYAEEEVSAGAVGHMCRSAELLSEVEDYLEQQTREACGCCVTRQQTISVAGLDGGKQSDEEKSHVHLRVDVEQFAGLHIALKKRLLLSLIRELAPGGRDIAAVHVEDVLALFEKQGNPRVDLPFGIVAARQYGQVILKRAGEAPKEHRAELSVTVKLPEGETPKPLCFDLGSLGQMEIRVFFVNSCQKIPENQYTKWLDCDKMVESPVLRFRRTGDYFSIADSAGGTVHKSLKDYMITEKIPRESRSLIPLLAEGSHVLWLVGYRISEYYKVTENTKRILQVKLIGG